MGVETILRASRLTATPAMTDDNQLSFNLPSVSRKKVTAAFDGGRLSSDSGVMLLALADRRRKVSDTLAALIADRRDPSHITHTVADVLRARMLAIGCGYPDGNDFDWLRRDVAFKLACGRLPDTGRDLCSQPTISRWENAPTLREIIRLTYALVDIWCGSYRKPPLSVVLDIDDTVDVVHGHQQLAQWNAHYDERCFPESIVPWLPGYENSSPVRVGNAAYQQLQIDVFGEVSDALAQARKAGMEITERGRAMRPLVIDHLARAWREPDEGIWEVRGGPQQTADVRTHWRDHCSAHMQPTGRYWRRA